MQESPALDWITIKGFKSISSIEHLKIHPINILIGSNGSGKSNFLEVFSFLNAIRNGRLRHYVLKAGGASNLLHFGAKNTQNLTIHVSFENEINQYEIQMSFDDLDNLLPFHEIFYFWKKSEQDSPFDWRIVDNNGEAGISVPMVSGIPSYIRQRLDSWRYYHFHDTSSGSPIKKNMNKV